MSHYFIFLGSQGNGFYWNIVSLVRLDRLFVNICALSIAIVCHSDFFKSQKSIIEFITDDDRRLERDRHVSELKRSVRHQFKYQTIWQFLADLHSKSSIWSRRWLDCTRDVCVWIQMLEDDSCSETDLFLQMTAWWHKYLAMLRSNWYFSDYARARKMRMLGVSSWP